MDGHTGYVRVDQHGVMRVGNTRVMLESVIFPFLRGDSPESIRGQYPALSLEEVYGAITYYLRHRDEVEKYLSKQEAEWEAWRAKIDQMPTPAVIERLRAMKQGAKAGRPQ